VAQPIPVRPQALPPGYTAYQQVPAAVPEPKGLRAVTLVCFGGATLFTLYLGVVAYGRGSLAEDFFAGKASLQQISHADDMVKVLVIALVGVQILAAILLALWTYATVKNAATRHPNAGHRPALAAFMWFVPFINYFVPWKALKTAALDSRGNTVGQISIWQTVFVLQVVAGWMGSRGAALTTDSTKGSFVAALHQQGVYFFVVCGLLAVATASAGVAMRAIDRATSGTGSAPVSAAYR
jgi:hypothetical protein